MGLIKILATFFIIYLVFRFVTLYIIPPIVRWQIFRYKKKFYEQNPHLRKDKENQESPPKSKPSDQIGEYVDYEEIKEDKKN